MRNMLLLLALAGAIPPPTTPNNSVSLTVATETPVVVTRPGHSVYIWSDRVQVILDGNSKPFTLLFDGTIPAPTPPAPTPDPTPTPTPTPPAPTPAGPLTGVVILPDSPTEVQSAMRSNTAVDAAFKELNATRVTFTAGEPVPKGPSYVKAINDAGGTPCVLWFDASGTFLKGYKVTDSAALITNLKIMRGK